MGLGFGGAQGDMGRLGGRLDHPQRDPQKSPLNIKDQVCLLGAVAICDED